MKESSEEFESLLGMYLWGELGGEGKDALRKLLEENELFRRRFREESGLHETLERVLEPEPGAASSPVASKTRDMPGSGSMGKRFAAVAAVLLVAPVAYLLTSLLWQGRSFSHTITGVIGSCRSGAKPLASGSDVNRRAVRSGADSLCDLRFQGPFQARIRLLPDSRLSSDFRDGVLRVYLERGGMLVQAERLSASSSLFVYRGGNRIRFLGTKILVRRDSRNILRVEALEGRVLVERSAYFRLSRLRGKFAREEEDILARRLAPSSPERERTVRDGDILLIREDPALAARNRARTRRLEKRLLSVRSGKNALADVLNDFERGLSREGRREFRRADFHHYRARQDSRRIAELRRAFRFSAFAPAPGKKKKDVPNASRREKKQLREVRRVLEAPEGAGGHIHVVYLRDGSVLHGFVHQQGEKFVIEEGSSRRILPRGAIKRIERIQ